MSDQGRKKIRRSGNMQRNKIMNHHSIDPNSISYQLGLIRSELSAVKESTDRIEKKVDAQDARLRSVEGKSAVAGTIAGGMMSVVVSMIIAKFQ